MKLGAPAAAARLAVEPLAVAQIVFADQLGRDKDVARMRRIATLSIPNEAEAFAGNLDHALGGAEFFIRSRLGQLAVVIVGQALFAVLVALFALTARAAIVPAAA